MLECLGTIRNYILMDESDDLEISGRDLDEALNIGNSRKKMTKDQQIYGIWAEESAESKPKITNSFINFSKKSDSMQKNYKIRPNQSVENFTSDDKHTRESSLKMLGMMGFKQGTGKGKRGLGILEPNQRNRKHINAQSEEEFGSWEKHTMGFGSKILQKMGFKQGQGLGKHGLGITEPVKAAPRQGKATLGAYGSEKPDTPQNIETKEQEPFINSDIKNVSKFPSWKKSGKCDQNYIKKTFAQLLSETQKKSLLFPEQSVKIVDMTGSETKVSFGYDSIQHSRQIVELVKHKNFDLPELYHNLLILVETTENSLKSNIKNVNLILLPPQLILKDVFEENIPTIDKAELFIAAFEEMHLPQYEDINLQGLIRIYFYPIIYSLIKSWDIFKKPLYLYEIFNRWRVFVNSCFTSGNQNMLGSNDPDQIFDRILTDLLIPRFSECLSAWNIPEYGPILNFLNEWKPLFSEKTWTYVQKALLTCILDYFEDWDPTPEGIPVHVWIQCYHDIFGSELEIVYKSILRKMMHFLRNWHPSNPYAISMLGPWKEILNVKKWYSGWKILFSDLINQPPVHFIFSQALELLEQSIKGIPLPPIKEYQPLPTN
ncbi:hypothetical protein MXB_146, partial [Myxobolus squamalis]